MNYTSVTALLTTLTVGVSSAEAHPGHGFASHGTAHEFTSPTHLWPWVAFAGIAALGVAWIRRRGAANLQRRAATDAGKASGGCAEVRLG